MNEVQLTEIPKTTEGLRDALFDEINLIREGKSNPQRARALSQLASQIIDSIRVQIQYGRLLSESDKAKGAAYLGTKREDVVQVVPKGNGEER